MLIVNMNPFLHGSKLYLLWSVRVCKRDEMRESRNRNVSDGDGQETKGLEENEKK